MFVMGPVRGFFIPSIGNVLPDPFCPPTSDSRELSSTALALRLAGGHGGRLASLRLLSFLVGLRRRTGGSSCPTWLIVPAVPACVSTSTYKLFKLVQTVLGLLQLFSSETSATVLQVSFALKLLSLRARFADDPRRDSIASATRDNSAISCVWYSHPPADLAACSDDLVCNTELADRSTERQLPWQNAAVSPNCGGRNVCGNGGSELWEDIVCKEVCCATGFS